MDTPPHSENLRIGRFTLRTAVYFVTSCTSKRRPLFRDPRFAHIVVDALDHYHDRLRVDNLAWVVMPDHVHWLFQLRIGTLAFLMRGFKAWTAAQMRKLLPYERGMRIWQAGYHDRCVRPHEDLDRYNEYIIGNPLRKGLCTEPREYPYLCASSEYFDMTGREPRYQNTKLPWEVV